MVVLGVAIMNVSTICLFFILILLKNAFLRYLINRFSRCLACSSANIFLALVKEHLDLRWYLTQILCFLILLVRIKIKQSV